MKPATINKKTVMVPDWANWLAQDESGFWFVYKAKPACHVTCWLNGADDRRPHKIFECLPNPKWKETLKQV